MGSGHLSVFDLDHTLFRVNSSYKFGTYLYQQKFFSLPELLILIGYYAIHKMGFLTITRLHQKNFGIFVLGRDLSVFQHHVANFLDKHWDEFIYPPAMEKLRQAKEDGHYTVIMSGSPDFLVAPIAERLGVKEWQATRYAVDDNRKMCEISHVLEGEDKANYLASLSERLGIAREGITAYSDSILDKPLLMAAGTVVGVNPDRQLRALCHSRNWQII